MPNKRGRGEKWTSAFHTFLIATKCAWRRMTTADRLPHRNCAFMISPCGGIMPHFYRKEMERERQWLLVLLSNFHSRLSQHFGWMNAPFQGFTHSKMWGTWTLCYWPLQQTYMWHQLGLCSSLRKPLGTSYSQLKTVSKPVSKVQVKPALMHCPMFFFFP